MTTSPCSTTGTGVDATTASALAALTALADPQRQQIMLRLTIAPVCTCGDLVTELEVAQPTVSHHLKVLRDAGFVEGERCGRYVNYTAVPARLREVAAALEAMADAATQACG